MPAIGFKCPDKVNVSFEDCFKACRLQDELPSGRCKALPFLRRASKQREWNGEPSTTMLLRGIRETWLKITRPYYINPDKSAFTLLGTQTHSILERFGKGDNLTEERLVDDICSGQFDFYDGETQTLYDYKTWGSYKIMQALGIKTKDVPMLDENGQPVYKKTGKNKGEIKTVKIFEFGDIATKATALLETSIQLSDYRDKLKAILPEGYTVKAMAIQAISRDGGLQVSTKRGIEENAPLIPLNGISSHWIKKYLGKKKQLLFEALEKDYAPMCRKTENWNGRKCADYCDVWEYCIQL